MFFDTKLLLSYLIVVVLALVYIPGLEGIFLLDDYGSIAPLGEWGQINSLAKWWSYVTTAYNGPNGRIVATASFTLNANTWPANPFWFLVTNLIVHTINFLLLLCFLKKLLTQARVEKAATLALVSAAIWALHPLQVSTVLYVVQRMAQLEFTFNALALIAYLYTRQSFHNLDYTKGFVWLAACGFSAVTALYSKETAILIPLQLVLIELFLVARGSRFKWPNRCWALIIVYIPAVILLILMIDKLVGYAGSSLLLERRGFTVQQRLFTELRVVGDYLAYFFVPRVQTAGVFHDGYALSYGWFRPVTTLIWGLVHFAFLSGAAFCWRRLPLIAFGVFWFYGNHLIESVVVQLEIKYEHRNYFPSIGLAVILACSLLSLPISKLLKNGLVAIVVVILSAATFARASLWGNPDKAVLVWMEENPNSTRALEIGILHFSQKPGADQLVKKLLIKGVARDSQDPVILLKTLAYDCDLLQRQYTSKSIVDLLANSKMQWHMGSLLDGLLNSLTNRPCSWIGKRDFQAMVSAIRSNSAFRSTRVHWTLDDLRARSEFLLGDEKRALDYYRAIPWRPGMLGMRMNQALFLASNNYQKAAADILEAAIVNAGQEDRRLLAPAKDMLSRIKQDITHEQ